LPKFEILTVFGAVFPHLCPDKRAAREARSVAELAATKKEDKYSGLAADYLFVPIVVEVLCPINESASDFLLLLAKKINQRSGDKRDTVFLFQRVFVLV